MDAPCKDCERRREACWGTCEAYKEYRRPFDAEQADLKRTRLARQFLSDSFGKQARKRRRK